MNLKVGSNQTTLLIVALSALVIGFLIGNATTVFNLKEKGASVLPGEEQLFDARSATVIGKINSIEGKKLKVTTNSGKQGELELADTVLVNKLLNGTSKRPTATSSSDLKTVEYNKDATIYLQYMDGKYKVNTISINPPQTAAPSLPPVPR